MKFLSMITCVIRSKASVPHDNNWVLIGAASIVIEEIFFLSVKWVLQMWELPRQRYSILALNVLVPYHNTDWIVHMTKVEKNSQTDLI